MHHIDYGNSSCSIAILIKDDYLHKDQIDLYYVKPLQKQGITDIIAFSLSYPYKKPSVSAMKAYLSQLLPILAEQGVKTLYVADAGYFKVLTKQTKAQQHLGYILPCAIKDFEYMNVCYGINYGSLVHNPNQVESLDLSIQTLAQYANNTLTKLGANVIRDAQYFDNVEDATDALERLKHHKLITCDIETKGLRIDDGMLSIAFTVDKHRGISMLAQTEQDFKLLKRFFESYRGTVIYHNASFDIKHIIYNCFMSNPLDYIGLVHGVQIMTQSIHDTKVIAYLALNSTAGNDLSLKTLAHPYLGNWAEDVKDATKIPKDRLLEYNLKDGLGTYYVFETYYPKMIQDKQLEIYNALMIPSLKIIIHAELVGLPIKMNRVFEVGEELLHIVQDALLKIIKHPATKQALHNIKQDKLNQINSKLKTIQHDMSKLGDVTFNPGSTIHMQELLFNVLGLPKVDFTAKGSPATGQKTISKLINHTDDASVKDLLQALIDLGKADKILTTFIPAFKAAQRKGDHHYLHGSFNLGGTLSGRLSSSKPNLQNLPSGSTYGSAIKSCIVAPSGWVMVGADFSSLEDRINALLTKDTNKLKVYTDHFDGHCLRAYYYWKDKMPDIDQADESDTCYQIGNQVFKATDTIEYQGQTFTGEQFYKMYGEAICD